VTALPANPVGVPLGALLPAAGEKRSALVVRGLRTDSRRLAMGDAFIAIPGERHDGRDYLAAAEPAGVSVILAESGLNELQRAAAGGVPVIEVPGLVRQLGAIAARFYGDPSSRMHLVGVTGTNGKTTTSRLLAQLLRRAYGHCGVVGTLGAVLDDSVEEVVNTTPDAIALHEKLAEWRDAGVEHAVLEVSSHALAQDRVSGLAFDTGIFTNLTRDHLDYHGDMDSYGAAKARLFQVEGLSAAVINADDAYSEKIAVVDGADRLRYSLAGKRAELVASDIDYRDNGLEARLRTPWGSGRLRSPLAGDFNLGNLIAALAAACGAGVDFSWALETVPSLRGIPGRMEYVPNGRGLQVVVDYAHTPDALRRALLALRPHTSGQLICVFGCGGDRDSGKRPEMGRIAGDLADRIVITSDNPRNESPEAIIADIQVGAGGDAEVEVDRARAISRAVAAARSGDCILVAGKGRETCLRIGAERLPFSDIEHLRRILAAEPAP